MRGRHRFFPHFSLPRASCAFTTIWRSTRRCGVPGACYRRNTSWLRRGTALAQEGSTEDHAVITAMPQARTRRSTTDQGFTLVETVVMLTVAFILSGALVPIVSESVDT